MKPFKKLIDLLPGLFPPALALVFTTLILVLAGAPPGEAYRHIVAGAFESSEKLASVLMAWVPLLLCSAGLLVTFTAGLWNIGVEGQIIAGAVFVTWLARNLTLPSFILLPILLLAGMLGGALWGLLCGGLKTHGKVHEIFGGVGLNFVAIAATNYLIFVPWKPADGATMSGTDPFPDAAVLPRLGEPPVSLVETWDKLREVCAWLPRLGKFPISPLALILVIAAIAVVYFTLRDTLWGLRLKAIGKNIRSARLMGVSTNREILLAFALCGALAGLAGAILSACIRQRLVPQISGGYGFLALLVVLLSGFRTLWTPPIAFFFAAVGVGSPRLELQMQLDSSLGGILESGLVLFVLLVQGLGTRITPSKG